MKPFGNHSWIIYRLNIFNFLVISIVTRQFGISRKYRNIIRRLKLSESLNVFLMSIKIFNKLLFKN